MNGFFRALFGTPTTPEMQRLATFVAILVLLLCTPMIFTFVQAYLEPFLIAQWGYDFYPVVNFAVWVMLFPAMFFMLKSSLSSSVGMAFMYFANLATPMI